MKTEAISALLAAPTLAEAAPGAPITAEAWNGMRQAILDLYDFLATGNISVTLYGDATVPLSGATVSVVGPDGVRHQAQPAGPSYLVTRLTPGLYTVEAAVPGYVGISEPVAVSQGDTSWIVRLLVRVGARKTVPSVKGMNLTDGVAKLKQEGFTHFDVKGPGLVPVDPENPGTYATAKILDQTLVGVEVDVATTTVELNVEGMAIVPNLVGRTLSEAIGLLSDFPNRSVNGPANLVINPADSIWQQAKVIAQTQNAGATLPTGTTIAFTLEGGVVPNLIGQPLSTALATLSSLGFGNRATQNPDGGNIDPNDPLWNEAAVERQIVQGFAESDPAVGQVIPLYRNFTLRVEWRAWVPNVVGLYVTNPKDETTDARRKLEAAGFSVGTISDDKGHSWTLGGNPPWEVLDGSVFGQSPAGAARAGAAITLQLQTNIVPDVTGLVTGGNDGTPESDPGPTAVLRAAGFRVGRSPYASSLAAAGEVGTMQAGDNAGHWEVSDQSPAGGNRAIIGSFVEYDTTWDKVPSTGEI